MKLITVAVLMMMLTAALELTACGGVLSLQPRKRLGQVRIVSKFAQTISQRFAPNEGFVRHYASNENATFPWRFVLVRFGTQDYRRIA